MYDNVLFQHTFFRMSSVLPHNLCHNNSVPMRFRLVVQSLIQGIPSGPQWCDVYDAMK